MEFEFRVDDSWQRWLADDRLMHKAVKRGLQRAGVQALEEVKQNFKRQGSNSQWPPLDPVYAMRKAAGKAAPGRQISHAPEPNLILTGALLQAAVMEPRTKLLPSSGEPDAIELRPNPSVGGRGKYRVGKYMDCVNDLREYFVIPDGSPMERVRAAFEAGFQAQFTEAFSYEGASIGAV